MRDTLRKSIGLWIAVNLAACTADLEETERRAEQARVKASVEALMDSSALTEAPPAIPADVASRLAELEGVEAMRPDERSGRPREIRGQLGNVERIRMLIEDGDLEKLQKALRPVLAKVGSVYGVRPKELRVDKAENDPFDFSHVYLFEELEGRPVVGSELSLHFDEDGALTSLTAFLKARGSLVAEPTLNVDEAQMRALEALEESMEPQQTATLSLDQVQLVYLIPQGRDALHLVWAVEAIYERIDRPSVRVETVYVDAHDGTVRERKSHIRLFDHLAQQSGQSFAYVEYERDRARTTDCSVGNPQCLIAANGQGLNPENVTTLNYTSWTCPTGATNCTCYLNGQPYSCTKCTCSGGFTSGGTNCGLSPVAPCSLASGFTVREPIPIRDDTKQAGARATRWLLQAKSCFNRGDFFNPPMSSYDHRNADLYAEIYEKPYSDQLLNGPGGNIPGVRQGQPFAATSTTNTVGASHNGVEFWYDTYFTNFPDISYHEYSHALSEFGIGNRMSAPLEEAFATINAVACSSISGDPDIWRLGPADGTGGGDVRTPTIDQLVGSCTDTACLGIAAHAYYLLVTGERHRTGRGGRTAALGIRDSSRIFWYAFRYLMRSAATFADMRAATVEAARRIFGVSSSQVWQVERAWYAVNVGASPAPCRIEVSPRSGTPSSTFTWWTRTYSAASGCVIRLNNGTPLPVACNNNGQVRPSDLGLGVGTHYISYEAYSSTNQRLCSSTVQVQLQSATSRTSWWWW